MHNSSAPMVTVIVNSYNMRDYIEQCLRSVAMQKTDFEVEAIVCDDCSPDGSQDVIRSLAPSLPSNWTYLLYERNSGDRGESMGRESTSRARGKYLAVLEGDDFWTYEGKLQEQVDFLESHPDFSAVFHRCEVVGKDGRPSGIGYPECPGEEYTFREFFYCSLPGQLGTSLYRREEYVRARETFMGMRLYAAYPGDRRNAFFTLCNGRVACLPHTWSAYRYVPKGSSSYSSTVRINDEYARNEVDFGRTIVRYAEHVGRPEAVRCAKLTYYRTLLKWSVGKVRPYRLGETLRKVFSERNWPELLFSPIRWYVVLGLRALRGIRVSM